MGALFITTLGQYTYIDPNLAKPRCMDLEIGLFLCASVFTSIK